MDPWPKKSMYAFHLGLFWTNPGAKHIPRLVVLLRHAAEKGVGPAVPPTWYPGTRAPGDAYKNLQVGNSKP